MPHPANQLIVEKMAAKGWFRNPQREEGLSDNWWKVEYAENGRALLYVVRFMADSERGEPKEIPNMPALPKIGKVHRNRGKTAGPFIALAEVSDRGASPDILSMRAWRLSAQHLSGVKRVRLEELGAPVFAC
jgi:hypothetical protein